MKLNTPCTLALFLMSLFAGVIIISIDVDTNVTALNTVIAPLVCLGDKIVPAQEYRGPQDLADPMVLTFARVGPT